MPLYGLFSWSFLYGDLQLVHFFTRITQRIGKVGLVEDATRNDQTGRSGKLALLVVNPLAILTLQMHEESLQELVT